MSFSTESLRLYAVTPSEFSTDRELLKRVEQAAESGITCLQLREKTLKGAGLLQSARAVKAICDRCHIPLIINDDALLAKKVGAAGVHLGQSDLALAEARALLGPAATIGISVHDVEEAVAAKRGGADYLGAGAVFPTATKTDATLVPLETLRAITSAVNIPVVAIGGIDMGNIGRLKGTGLAGISIVSGIFGAPDIPARVRKLLAAAKKL